MGVVSPAGHGPFEKRRQVWSQPSAMDAGAEVLVE